MKTNTDLLEHAVRLFPAQERAFDQLSLRRDRKRRNQRITAGAAGLTISAALVFLLVGAMRSQPSQGPGGTEPIGLKTTATVNGITITYPDAWFAADPVDVGLEPPGEPKTLPALILVVSSVDPASAAMAGCPGLSRAAPAQALMTVQEQPLTLVGEGSTPWPVPLELGEEATGASSCYPGWTFLRATWTASGRSFEGVAGFGPEATESDRDALMDAYASMSFSPEGPVASEATIVGEGSAPGGATWSLSVMASDAYCLNVEGATSSFGSCSADPPSVEIPEVGINGDGTEAVFAVGTVPDDVSAVVLETSDGVIGDIDLLDGPRGAPQVHYFVVPLPAAGAGTLRFQSAKGNDVYPSQRIDWTSEGGATG